MDHQRQSNGGRRIRRSHAVRARRIGRLAVGQPDLRHRRWEQVMRAGLASQWCGVAGAVVMAAALAFGVADAAAQQQQQKNAQLPPPQQKNQGPPNALQGFSQNRDEPVKIRAASLEVREKDKMATFTGDVHVLQGDTEMHCKVLVVFYEEETGARAVKTAEPGPGGDRQIRRIEAKGNVVVVQKDQNATGDAATFNMRENTVTLVG